MSRSQYTSSEFRNPVVPSDDSHNGIHHFETMFNWGFPMGVPHRLTFLDHLFRCWKKPDVPSSLVKSLQTPNVSPTRSQYYPIITHHSHCIPWYHHTSYLNVSEFNPWLYVVGSYAQLKIVDRFYPKPIRTNPNHITGIHRLYAYYIPVLSWWFFMLVPAPCLAFCSHETQTNIDVEKPTISTMWPPPSYKLV